MEKGFVKKFLKNSALFVISIFPSMIDSERKENILMYIRVSNFIFFRNC